MVPEIWSAMDKIFLSFWTVSCRFNPLTTWKIKIWKKWKNHLEILSFFTCVHKWQSHDVWFLRYGAWRTKFFCHLDFSCAFTPNNPKNQHFEKIKIKSGDIIMLHMCTINDIHMMYGFWDIKCDRQSFLSFWTVVCPFNPLTTWKIEILKNWKKYREILSFYHSLPKIMIICYTLPEIRYGVW